MEAKRGWWTGVMLVGFMVRAGDAAAQQAGAAPASVDVPVPKSTIGISNIVVRLDGRDEIGLANRDFRIHLIERLRQRGFEAVGAESLVFNKDESHRALFRVGGIVRELDCKEMKGQLRCGLGVEWQVLDVERDAIVYSVLTRGTVLDAPRSAADRIATTLFLRAFDSLLARGDFRRSVTMRPDTQRDRAFPLATFGACAPGDRKMPERAEEVLDATVVVRTPAGFGSGFFLSADGLVITAAHVIDAPTVTMRLRDGSEIPAIPVRVARRADVALLRPSRPIEAHRCLAVSPSQAPPSIGSEIYAAGAPAQLDLAFTLTRGILSATRERDGRRLLQTDAPVSPGNSGGPMVDTSGNVVGVTAAKLVGAAVEGLAFGIPIDDALATLGLKPGAASDEGLLTAPASPTEAVANATVKGTPDPPYELDPDGARKKAAEAAAAARRAELAERAKIEEARKNERDRRTPLYLKVFNYGGIALGIAGGVTIGWSAGSYDSQKSTRSEFESMRTANTIGWITLGVGVAGVISYFLLRPPLAPASGRATASRGFGEGLFR